MINVEYESIEEFEKSLYANGTIGISRPTVYTLDISKVLREDKTINLELLEVIATILASNGITKLYLHSIDKYAEIRGYENNIEEEVKFIYNIMKNLLEEYSEEKGVIINYVQSILSNTQDI